MKPEDVENFLEQDKQEKEFIEKQERDKNDLLYILKFPEGRRVIQKLLYEMCFVHSTIFCETDRETNFQLGRQSIGMEIQNMILEKKPAVLTQLRVERLAEIKKGDK
jgi:hypothetical protein